MNLTQKDFDHYYTAVEDVISSLSYNSPDTAGYFMDHVKNRDKSPFDILLRLSKKLMHAAEKRTTLP